MPATVDLLTAPLEELVRRAARRIAPDVRAALEQAARDETNPTARGILETLLAKADAGGHALASDTGLVTFFVRVGCAFPGLADLGRCLSEAVERATRHEPLSEFVADLKTGHLHKGNVGRGVPVVHLELDAERDDCEVTVLLKGAGSDQLTTLWELPVKTTPEEIGARLRGLIEDAGGKPCPPLLIGVGVGGTPEQALMLSRRALLRDAGAPSPDATVAAWERGWLAAVNDSGIGPMGLGGATTAFAVHAETADHHRAYCPVGVSVACWSDRRATVRILADGSVQAKGV